MKSKKIDIEEYNNILFDKLSDYLDKNIIKKILEECKNNYSKINEKNKSEKTKKIDNKNFKFEEEVFSYTENEDLRNALFEFYEMRKSFKKPILTKGTLTRLFNKLNKIANTDDEKIATIEKSIINNWQDIWQIKAVTDNTKNTTQSKNQSALNTVKMSEEEWENIILSRNKLEEFSKTV